MSAIQHAIFRNFHPPHFSGNEEDWGNFMKDFKKYVQVLGQHRNPTDAEILILFGSSLPSHMNKEIDFLTSERGGNLTFGEVMQYFNTIFTKNRVAALRKKLREINLPKSGKITPQILRTFEIDFRNCIRELPQLSREEIGEVLRGKLLDYMTQWVVEKEKELDRTAPIIQITFPTHACTPEQVQMAIKSFTTLVIPEIKKVEPGIFEVKCENLAISKALRGLSGKFVRGSSNPILVQVKTHTLGVNDIFEVVHEKLEIKQIVADANASKIQSLRQTRPITTQNSEKNRSRDNSASSSEKNKNQPQQSPKNKKGEAKVPLAPPKDPPTNPGNSRPSFWTDPGSTQGI